jgi:hypothetical protein
MSILSFLKSILKISDSNNYYTTKNYQILKADFVLMISGVASYKGTPSKVYLRKAGIKQVQYITYTKYLKIKAIWDAFVNQNKRQPNYVYINDPIPTPHTDWILVKKVIFHHQETAYTCGPSSSMEALSTFGVTGESESEMAKLEETTKNGTSHGPLMAGIISEAIKHNVSLTVHEAKYIDVGWTGIATAIKAGMAIIVHGICEGWPTYYKVYKGGHYVDIIGINLTTQQVRIADPDRGIIEYSMDEFKNGMLLNSQPALIVISRK